MTLYLRLGQKFSSGASAEVSLWEKEWQNLNPFFLTLLFYSQSFPFTLHRTVRAFQGSLNSETPSTCTHILMYLILDHCTVLHGKLKWGLLTFLMDRIHSF
jgi:hypothetical protein